MPYVYLDVGGTLYATSKMTLEKIGDSMLAKLCQPCWEDGGKIGTTRDNPIIIDRDGKMFEYILNYLRRETFFSLPNADLCFFKDLFVEAHYFGISTLCSEIYDNYFRPEKMWVSPIGFKPMQGQSAKLARPISNACKVEQQGSQGQSANLTATDDRHLSELALILASSEIEMLDPPDGILFCDISKYEVYCDCGRIHSVSKIEKLEAERRALSTKDYPDLNGAELHDVQYHSYMLMMDEMDDPHCEQLGIHLCEKQDVIKAQFDSALVTFVRIPAEHDICRDLADSRTSTPSTDVGASPCQIMPDMVDVKFVVDGEEYPKNDYVVRMSLWDFRPDFFLN